MFADVRKITSAQVRASQRQRLGQAYLLGDERASFVEFVHRVGAMLGKRTPKGATPAFARLANAWSQLSRREPDVSPEVANLICHKLQVDSAETRRKLDYVERPLDRLLADTLEWMHRQGMLGRPPAILT